ncbi:MAG: hypothetical protein Q4Q07_09950 [Tissierellia bacterium]|nr:hypothetical protein [Tissierellia bacterium]
MKKSISQGGLYYLLKSKETRINGILEILFGGGFLVLLMMVFSKIEEDYGFLIFHILLFGLGNLFVSEMVVDLLLGDLKSGRIEFFLLQGISLKNIIRCYPLPIFRLTGIPIFVLFLSGLFALPWKISAMNHIVSFLCMMCFMYLNILFLEIFILKSKHLHLMKNILYFGSFFIIFLASQSSRSLLSFLHSLGLSIYIFIPLLYIIIIVGIGIYTINSYGKIKNSDIISERRLEL